MAGRPTKTQDVFNAISLDIAQGRLSPGTSLDETLIAERYGVSRTPIREALRQLDVAGLVDVRPHRGAVVRMISERELDDMFAVMAELEGLCARWASFSMTVEERRSLQAIHNRSGDFVKAGDNASYVDINDAFHSAIYAGSHNGYLEEITRAAWVRVAPFRHAQFADLARLAKSHAEHERVLSAILRGDGEAAHAAMRAHINVVRDAVEAIAQHAAKRTGALATN